MADHQGGRFSVMAITKWRRRCNLFVLSRVRLIIFVSNDAKTATHLIITKTRM